MSELATMDIESSPEPLQAPLVRVKKHGITKENWAQMQEKALAKRRENALKRLEKERQPEVQAPEVEKPIEKDETIQAQLKRVRAHIDRLDGLLEACDDAGEIDKLCRALSTLREDERKLAGRPLPGSFRPTSKTKIVRGGDDVSA
jgi:hypothetical protein